MAYRFEILCVLQSKAISKEEIVHEQVFDNFGSSIGQRASFGGRPRLRCAVAAPLAPVAAIVAPVSDWSGLYVGAQVGTLNGEVGPLPIQGSFDGVMYGGHVGGNWEWAI